MGEYFRRIQYLIHRRRLDRELESDMEFHREMAARAGRSNFGNTLRMRERAREAWGWTWLDRLIQDLRYAVRVLARSPGFTLMAVLVLAIGIGVNVAAFTVFDIVTLEPLPVRDPGSLVRLERRSPNAYTDGAPYASLLFYQKNAKTLSAVMGVLGVAFGVVALYAIFLLPFLHRRLVQDDWTLKSWEVFHGPLLWRRGPVPPRPEGFTKDVVQDYYRGTLSNAWVQPRGGVDIRVSPNASLNLGALYSDEVHQNLGSYENFSVGTTIAF